MKKEILLLTKSKKNGGYCTAGIDIETGDWIRLILAGYDAVPKYYFKYDDNTKPEVLDTICVDVIQENLGDSCHPEDVLIKKTFKKSNTNGIDSLLKRIKDDHKAHNLIYYSTLNKIYDTIFSSFPEEDRYSLMIIEPRNIVFYTDHKNKLSVKFSYKGRNYSNIRVTDEKIISKFSDVEDIEYGIRYPAECYFVISLGEPFEDGNRYKLLASVINKEDI